MHTISTPAEGEVVILRRPLNAPKPTVDKSVSAHFPDWDEPLEIVKKVKKLEPFSTLTPLLFTTKKMMDYNTKDISEIAKFPKKEHHTHCVTQYPEARTELPNAKDAKHSILL
jgi:hypothetical protein